LAFWLGREGRVALAGAVITGLFLVGRIAGSHGLAEMEAYRPVLSVQIYLDRAGGFLWRASYRRAWMTPPVMALMVLLAALVAVRSRALPPRFALAWMLIGILPVAFISQRGLDAVWIPALGMAMYVAWGLRELSFRLAPRFGPRPVVLFAALLVLLAAAHYRYARKDWSAMLAEGRHIRKVYNELRTRHGGLTATGHILFVEDPFPESGWTSAFLVFLLSGRSDMHVYRLDRLLATWKPEEVIQVSHAFAWCGNRLVACDPEVFSNVPIRELTGRRCVPRE
jgi:hypothetical protein